MESKFICTLKKDYRIFKKYLVYYLPFFKANIERPYLLSFEEYSYCLKIIELDNEFKNSLTKEEIYSLDEWTKSHNQVKTNYVESAFEKWCRVFFKTKLINDLDSCQIGIVLKALRTQGGKTMSDLANAFNVNRKTIHLVENGNRLPSLELVYKYSKLFDISIDKIIAIASK